MRILALDTATEACSAALLLDDTLVARYEEPKRGHAELILPMVDALLTEARISLHELDCLAVGRGPGAFTGVRIAVSVAQGLAFGAGRLIVPVSDLAALAQLAADRHGARHLLSCIDARIGEVYWGAFEVQPDGLVRGVSAEQVSAPAAVSVSPGLQWFGAGSGWAAYPQIATELERAGATLLGGDGTLLPRAQEIARLAVRDFAAGLAVSPELALPVYLRDQVAVSSRK